MCVCVLGVERVDDEPFRHYPEAGRGDGGKEGKEDDVSADSLLVMKTRLHCFSL